MSESAIQNGQRKRTIKARTNVSEDGHSCKSVKFSDMCGEFDSLQHPPPGNPEDFRRVLGTGLLKNTVFQQTEQRPEGPFKGLFKGRGSYTVWIRYMNGFMR